LPVAPGTQGMLCVQGPNVMRGYLGNLRERRGSARWMVYDWRHRDDGRDGFLTSLIGSRASARSGRDGATISHRREAWQELSESPRASVCGLLSQMEKKASASLWCILLPTMWLGKTLERFAQSDSCAVETQGQSFVRVNTIPSLEREGGPERRQESSSLVAVSA